MKIFNGMKTALAAALTLFALSRPAAAQEQPDPEKMEKQLLEYIDKEVERLSSLLDLEYWQEFYVDSTLNHNLHAMQEELMGLSSAKVSNAELYQVTQDKWMEATYRSFERFLNEDQWKKYLKTGAARDKKARDKRQAKRNDS